MQPSQNHRITECSGLERTSVGHLVQPFCRSRVTYGRLQRTLSGQVLNISRERDSTTSLGSLFQWSVTLRGKKFFLMFRRKSDLQESRAPSRVVITWEDKCYNSEPPLSSFFPRLYMLSVTSYSVGYISLWSAGVSCPGCVPPQLLVRPQATR